jgi:hypothetical protein
MANESTSTTGGRVDSPIGPAKTFNSYDTKLRTNHQLRVCESLLQQNYSWAERQSLFLGLGELYVFLGGEVFYFDFRLMSGVDVEVCTTISNPANIQVKRR